MRRYFNYILNLVLLWILFSYVFPNFILKENKFVSESGTLRYTYIETYKHRTKSSFDRYVDKQRLVLVTSDSEEREYRLEDEFSEYWGIFQEPASNGKYIRLKLDTKSSKINPIEIELDNKKIYGKNRWMLQWWLIIFGTFAFTVYNLYNIFENHDLDF